MQRQFVCFESFYKLSLKFYVSWFFSPHCCKISEKYSLCSLRLMYFHVITRKSLKVDATRKLGCSNNCCCLYRVLESEKLSHCFQSKENNTNRKYSSAVALARLIAKAFSARLAVERWRRQHTEAICINKLALRATRSFHRKHTTDEEEKLSLCACCCNSATEKKKNTLFYYFLIVVLCHCKTIFISMPKRDSKKLHLAISHNAASKLSSRREEKRKSLALWKRKIANKT